MTKCSIHTENNIFYHDSLHETDICFQCVLDWFGEHREQKEHVAKLTYMSCGPDVFIDIGNFESGKTYRNYYKTIINVSDSFSEYATHWFPINEISPWTYAPFYWFKKIADRKRNEYILVHCAAGIHRSLMMAHCWLLSLGYSQEQSAEIFNCPNIIRDYYHDIQTGIIPEDLLVFYKIMNDHPTWSLPGCLRDLGIPNLLNNTSLRKTTKYQDYLGNTL